MVDDRDNRRNSSRCTGLGYCPGDARHAVRDRTHGVLCGERGDRASDEATYSASCVVRRATKDVLTVIKVVRM